MKKLMIILCLIFIGQLNAEVLDSKQVLMNRSESSEVKSIEIKEKNVIEVKGINKKVLVKHRKTVKSRKKVIRKRKVWLPWSTEIYFPKNSYRLTKRQRLKLHYIRVPRNAKIYVKGFASSRGYKKHNFRLSKSRAWVVYKYLKKKYRQNKIYFSAYGEFRPRYSNKYQKGRDGNQRVKILIKK